MARILIIDDDDLMRETMRRILETAGHEVEDIADARLGLPLVTEQKIDLVITDLLMPKQDGIETLQQFHKLSDAPPILAISGSGASSLYLRAAAALGAAATLAKPFTAQALNGKVDMLLRAGRK